MKENYLEKFKDPRWQKIRLKILERDNWTCQKCFNPDSTLHIHHRYYLKNKEPWEYPLEALITLCEQCHEDEKQDRQKLEQELLQILKEKFFAWDLSQLIYGFSRIPVPCPSDLLSCVFSWIFSDIKIREELTQRYLETIKKTTP